MTYRSPLGAFQRISHTRSNRFPLLGVGCCSACSAPPPVSIAGLGRALGLDFESAGVGIGITAAGFLGLGVGWFAHQAFAAPRSNRGRRARRRRSN